MKRTLKTIAWICLTLGILGLVINGVMIMKGRALVVSVKEKIESGDFSSFGNHFKGINDENGFRPEGSDTWSTGPGGKFGFGRMHGRRDGYRSMGGHNRFAPNGHAMFAIPLFFLTAGPVLTVIGAVTLIVNRESGKEKKKAIKKKK